MVSKKPVTMLFISIIILSFIPIFPQSAASGIESLPFKQEITVPIDTSWDEAKHQPIDIRIEFTNPCWAKNETLHSVRVCYDDGTGLTEIESQIYGLEFIDNSHIKACNLVFLIPAEANGKEKYYVLYDDSETPPPNYPDHLKVEDTHYFYEPISGQKMDFDYYKITEDGYVVYGICQQGVLLGEGVSHTVLKLKPNSTEFETQYADQFAGFAFTYSIDGVKQYTGSARAESASKTILVDGNLMVRMRIESIAPEGTVKTSNIYTYYYCPTSTKRIAAHVNHEVLKTVEVGGDKERDGTYASLSTFKSRSATIEKMNVGIILPYLHVYGEDDTVKEYSIPPDPDSEKPEWILSTTDDGDLGSRAWLCLDDISTGKTHGLVFKSNKGFLEGEKDGVQVKASVKQVVKLPGLEADTGNLFATRNAYENGKHDTIIPEGMKVTFDAEFVTFEKEGYKALDAEAVIYQQLVAHRPLSLVNVSKEEEKRERYTLTTYVHLAPSFPLGSVFSAVVGKNFSYLYAELYKDNSLSSSGSIGRLSLSEGMELNFENTTLVEKIKLAIGLFDWKNFSFFKKIRFPDLESGKYLIKVYRENPFFGKERQYIGFGVVDLQGNISTHIFCKPEGKLEFSVADQNGKGIKLVRFLLLQDDIAVAETFSDVNGSVVLKAPCLPLHPYTLQVIYQGFLVEEKKVRLGLRHHFLPLKEVFTIPLYQLQLQVKDTWGLTPAIDVSPTLRSEEMIEPVFIPAEKQKQGKYLFSDLYPADYILRMSYKSFVIEEKVSLNEDKTLELRFPAEFTVDVDAVNSYGTRLQKGEISFIRDGKNVRVEIKQNGKAEISLPPGTYEMKVYINKEVARQAIDVKGNKEVTVVTTQDSFIHAVVTYLGVILAVFSIVFVLWKRNTEVGLKLFALALIVIAVVSPWWTLTGDNGVTETTTKTLLYPSKMVTLTSSSTTVGGEIGSVPMEFTMVLNLLSLLLVVTCLFIVFSILLKNRLRKTSVVLLIIGIILLIAVVTLFFYAMSQVTAVGVGGFTGNKDLEITLPGLQGSTVLPCSWGAGIGFYLSVVAVVCLIAVSFLKRKTG